MRGVTIHTHVSVAFEDLFQIIHRLNFPKAPNLKPKQLPCRHFKMSGLKKSVIRNMELLIMMVVCFNFYDAMDIMMQTVRKKYCFCVLYIGDFIAVATGNSGRRMAYAEKLLQRKISIPRYQHPPYTLNFKDFRQTDDTFISLNNLRNNQISQQDIQTLNQYVKPDFDLKQQVTLP
jgi:hypothetical protein